MPPVSKPKFSYSTIFIVGTLIASAIALEWNNPILFKARYFEHSLSVQEKVAQELFEGTCSLAGGTDRWGECIKQARARMQSFLKLKDEKMRYEMLMDACLNQSFKPRAPHFEDQIELIQGGNPRGDVGRCTDEVLPLVSQ